MFSTDFSAGDVPRFFFFSKEDHLQSCPSISLYTMDPFRHLINPTDNFKMSVPHAYDRHIPSPTNDRFSLASSEDSVVSSVLDELDFGQEFKLLPFILSNRPFRPPPHEIRENYRRFVLYLEPSPNSRFYQSIEAFHNGVFDKYGPNQAQQYPPHCSLTNMMSITRLRNNSAKCKFSDSPG